MSSSIPYGSTSTTSKVSSFCTFAAHLFCTICFSLLAAAALCFALFQHIIDHLEACMGCSLICYCNWLIAKLLAVCALCFALLQLIYFAPFASPSLPQQHSVLHFCSTSSTT
jgi:hypothetical protein